MADSTVFSACTMLLLSVVAVSCVISGPAMLIAGGALMASAKCETVQVVPELSRTERVDAFMRSTAKTCDVAFSYTVDSRLYNGSLATTCNDNNSSSSSASVAVCYPMANPGRYTAAPDASDLTVVPPGVPLLLLVVGASLTVVISAPIAISWVANAMCQNRVHPQIATKV